jgi:hypothetical protein
MIASFLDFIKKSDKKIISVGLILCFIAAVFSGIRFNIGVDDFAYKELFNEVPNLFDWIIGGSDIHKRSTEIGFLTYLSTLKTILNNEDFFIFVTAFILVFIHFFAFYKYSPFPLISLCFYFSHEFFMKDWTTLRAGLSSGITLILVIHYVLQSKVIKNYLSIGFAFLFHTQSIAAVPIYYLNKLKLTKKKLLITLSVIILVSAAVNLKDLLLNFMVLLKVINSRSVEYLFNDFFGKELKFTDITLLKAIIMLIFYIAFSKDYLEKDPVFKVCIIYFFLGVSYLLLFRTVAIFGTRLYGQLYSVEPILAAYMVYIHRHSFKKVLIYGYLILFLLATSVYDIYLSELNKTNNFLQYYQTIFNKDEKYKPRN